MSRLILPFLAVAVSCSLAQANTREEEAKKYAQELKHKDAKVRANAAKELGRLGQLQRKLALPYIGDITKAMSDSDASVRAEAAKTLGHADPEDKKTAVEKVAGLLKEEKSGTAREGQATALGILGSTAEEADIKKMARDALLEARKKTDNKREQKVIQAALQMITGKKKN